MQNQTILITGANRGLGAALVEEALKRGARRVYAASRRPLAHRDPRVVNVPLDITNEQQIQEAAQRIPALDILINNAGYAEFDGLRDRSALERHLAVNLYGPYAMMQAFLPALTRAHGTILNVLSITSMAGLPIMPAYAISKAAAFSLSQSLRALLHGRVRISVALPGPIDTDMVKGLDIPKTSPQSVATAVFDGLENGEEEIFPDPVSASIATPWRDGALKALERQFATYLQPEAVAS